MKFGAKATVNTEELLIHDRRQRQTTKRVDTSIVNPFAIFVLALQLESKVVRQVATFVVTAQEPERIRVPDL